MLRHIIQRNCYLTNNWAKLDSRIKCLNCFYDLEEFNVEEWAILTENLALRPIGDKILVLEDKFKTGYECSVCDGKGHTDEVCPVCNGLKMEETEDANGNKFIGMCRACRVGSSDGRKAHGFKLCPNCSGKQALLIVPEDTEKPPTTGKIIACGSQVTEYRPGNRVLYTNYTGNCFQMAGMTLRVMRQHDCMCQIKGYENKSINEEPHKELTETGV